MIKAVLFDFDGVVVDSEKLHMKTFFDLFEKYGINVSQERWYSEFAGTGSRHIIEVLSKELKVKEDINELVERRKHKYEERVQNRELELIPGVVEFLTLIKKKGIKTAVVSGSHRTNVQLALKMFKLEKYFDIIVSGDDLKERKPNPAPFLHAAKLLGVMPCECLGIEDSKAGSQAVVSAKMKLVIIRSPISKDLNGFKAPIIDDFRTFPLEMLQ
jgi:beta-phosphoglucomutase family hydrolase